MGNPDLRCVNISSRHLSFITFALIATDSFTSCFVQLKNGPNLRIGIRSECRRLSNTRGQLSAGMILWTQGLLPSTVSGQSLPPSSYAILKLKKKRVSVKFVNTNFFIYTLFFFNKCFPLAEMTTKFNKDMYAKMRSKEDEPLSNIRKKTVRVTGKGPSVNPTTSVTPVVSGVEMTRTASPSTLVEELPTPASKRPRLSDKEKEKVDPRTSTVWDDERLAVDRAHGVVTAEDLKVFSGVPFNNITSRHIHKLVQVKCLCNF